MIPEHRRDRAVQDYLSAISGIEASLIIKESGNFLPSLRGVSDIVSVFEEATNNTSDTQKVLFLLGIFAFDVRASLDRVFDILLREESYGRFLNILEKRIAGQVLQEIADSLGLTRERVRQLECKGIKLLNEHLMPLCVDIIAFIDMENNFEKIITHEELRRCIGDARYFDLFLYAMKTNAPWDTYQYHKRFQVFCRRDLYDRIDTLSGYMNALPAIIDKDGQDAALESLCVRLDLPLKIVMMEFVNAYKPAGRVYYRGKLSLAIMYDYVLEKYYPEGIKLFDDAIIDSFKKQVIDVFGEIDVSENNHAIYSRITSVSVLCDRGTYIHPCFVTIDAGLIDEIASHILGSPKGSLPFGELFEDFRQKLALRSNINNKYFLHGALELRLKDRFLFTRDAISRKTKT